MSQPGRPRPGRCTRTAARPRSSTESVPGRARLGTSYQTPARGLIMTITSTSTGAAARPGLLPARPPAAQAHALRAAAQFLERTGMAGLSVTADDDGLLIISVPQHAGNPPARIATVAFLAAAIGAPAPPAPYSAPWPGSPPPAPSPGTTPASPPPSTSRKNRTTHDHRHLRPGRRERRGGRLPAAPRPPRLPQAGRRRRGAAVHPGRRPRHRPARPGRPRAAAGHRGRRRRSPQAHLPAALGRPARTVDHRRLRLLRPARRRRTPHPRARHAAVRR